MKRCVVILRYAYTFLSGNKKVQKPGYVLRQTLVQFGAFQGLQLVDCRNQPRQLVPLNCAFSMGNGNNMTEQKKINLDLVLIKYQVSA